MAIARDVTRAQKQTEMARVRAAREQERHYRAALREAERDQRAYLKDVKEAEREEKRLYHERRLDEAATLTAEAREAVEELEGILGYALLVNDKIDFDSLRIRKAFDDFKPAAQLSSAEPEPVAAEYLRKAVLPTGWQKMMPGAARRRERSLQAAQKAYEQASAQWKQRDDDRRRALAAAEQAHNAAASIFELKKANRNSEVDEFQEAYAAGDPQAIISYCSMVLERSQYPDGFSTEFSLAYSKDSQLLILEYALPNVDIIPSVLEYRYVRTRDEIVGKPRKPAELKTNYQDVIAAIALRTLHELFEADHHDHVAAICFNGYLHTVNPATGQDIRPHLISVRTTREKFLEVDLARIDKRVCLKNLGAQVSRSPEEASPVKPIVEFSMADARFVDQADMISGLSSAPNLMDYNPYEFENLIANLFGEMGLESKLTRSSRDGGVDCVAFDKRPVLGGKVVIQAKRYRHTVGVSAVRDLYGTMLNEGANKGILVTTSGYGQDAMNFAQDKPIELIDGGQLLYLLQEVGIEARIIMPELD